MGRAVSGSDTIHLNGVDLTVRRWRPPEAETSADLYREYLRLHAFTETLYRVLRTRRRAKPLNAQRRWAHLILDGIAETDALAIGTYRQAYALHLRESP